MELVPEMPHKKHAQDLWKKNLFEIKCLNYVEFCKFCLSHPGKLGTKVDLNVLCIFSYVAFLVLVPIRADTLYMYIAPNRFVI